MEKNTFKKYKKKLLFVNQVILMNNKCGNKVCLVSLSTQRENWMN